MARMRMVKPGFFANDTLAELDPLARLLFIGLWCIADREGRLEDRPKRIKAEVLPYDDANVDSLLQSLNDSGFILRYTHGESRYVQVVNFSRHQTPHIKEVASTIPAPYLHCADTVQEPPFTDTDTFTGTDTDYVGADAPLSEAADADIGRNGVDSTPKPSSDKQQTPDFAEDSEPYRLAVRLRDAIRAHKPDARLPTSRKQMMTWARVLDLMIRVDKREPTAIAETIAWATKHHFWQAVILSPGKLREKYDQIAVQRRNAANGHNGRASSTLPSSAPVEPETDTPLARNAQATSERLARIRREREAAEAAAAKGAQS